MEQKELGRTSNEQLNLVLSFFPRVDTKASVVLAVDTGMLGYLAAQFQPLSSLRVWEMVAPAFVFALVGLSLWQLYKCAFPNLEGGEGSLVYFREIAKRTERKFIEEFWAQRETDYVKDLLGQTWRNSVILKEKFHRLKWAFNFMACAVLPWTVTLVDFAVRKR